MRSHPPISSKPCRSERLLFGSGRQAPRVRLGDPSLVRDGDPGRSRSWRTSTRMTYESSSAASAVSLAPFGLRIIRAMQPSAARGETTECVANDSRGSRWPSQAKALVASAAVGQQKGSSATTTGRARMRPRDSSKARCWMTPHEVTAAGWPLGWKFGNAGASAGRRPAACSSHKCRLSTAGLVPVRSDRRPGPPGQASRRAVRGDLRARGGQARGPVFRWPQ